MTYGYNVIPSPTHTPGKPLSTPIVFFDDFLVSPLYTGTAGAEASAYGKFSRVANNGEWLFVNEAGAATMPVPSDDADGGWITAVTDANTSDDFSAQLNGEPFKLAAGRNLYWEMKLKVSAVTVNALFGLALADATPFASAPAEYIAFRLSDGADIEFTCDTGSAAPAFVDSGVDIVADTFVVLAFEWIAGSSRIKFYVDGVHVGTKTTTIPLNQHLSPIFGLQTTTDAAKTLTVDYILVVNDRHA
ncbi:MAG TPA: LamG-like jellyroll fold domain-containing protein [Methylomirabilota bacterium]